MLSGMRGFFSRYFLVARLSSSAGIGTGDGVAEQKILAANDKGPDRVLDEIIIHAYQRVTFLRPSLAQMCDENMIRQPLQS